MPIKIKSYEIEENVDVYDIEVEDNHNFLLENGIIAHNCSHSVSYAILAYNEMYIKHHYPLYFWAGKLTVQINKEEKLQSYASECRATILSPCVINSHYSDIVIENGSHLRLPLSILKGVGIKAAESAYNLFHKHLPISIDELCQILRTSKDTKGTDAREVFDSFDDSQSGVEKTIATITMGKTKKLDMTGLATLTLFGAFDNLIARQNVLFNADELQIASQNILIEKLALIDKLKSAINSKAMGLSKKKEKLKWGDVKTELDLAVWSSEHNPMFFTPLWEQGAERLESVWKYKRTPQHEVIRMMYYDAESKTPKTTILEDFETAESDLYRSHFIPRTSEHNKWKKKPKAYLGIAGILTEIKEDKTKTGKTRFKYTFWSGRDTREVSFWEKPVSLDKKCIGELCLVKCELNPWNGKDYYNGVDGFQITVRKEV